MSLRCVILYCNVGWCVKCSAPQSSVVPRRQAKWLVLSVTVRVRARAREWDFFPFLSVLKVTNTFVLHVNSICDVYGIRGLRITTVCDVAMMYCNTTHYIHVHLTYFLPSGKIVWWTAYTPILLS